MADRPSGQPAVHRVARRLPDDRHRAGALAGAALELLAMKKLLSAITHRAGESGMGCSDCGVEFRQHHEPDTDVGIIETPSTYVEYRPGTHDSNDPCLP